MPNQTLNEAETLMADSRPAVDLISAKDLCCPATKRRGPGWLRLSDGRIADVHFGDDPPPADVARVSVDEGLVLPGLVDIHAHPAMRNSVFGIDPDRHMRPAGVTTVMSQGDAGADNCDAYFLDLKNVRTNVVLAINLSRVGEATAAGCFADLENANVDACVAAIERHRERVWGIAVNVSHHACATTDPRVVARRGREAAERVGKPMLYGMRRAEEWPLGEQLELLRPGDLVTYCFRSEPHCIVAAGRVLDEVRAARERGVLFDAAHGMASLDLTVAAEAVADGFLPDSISSDLYRAHIEAGDGHCLTMTLSKMVAAGMPFEEAIAAVTTRPAEILRRQDIGRLAVGARADLVVLKGSSEPEMLVDYRGQQRSGTRWSATPLL